MGLREKYGDWALITGASSGIGLEFARHLASEKINLFIAARRFDRLKAIALELSAKERVSIIPVKSDLTKENSITELINSVGDKPIGILINNAGFGVNGNFSSNDPAAEADMVKLNCLAPVMLSHHFIPQMIERKKGAVIFLGSVLAFQPSPLMAVYSSTKAFNMLLGEALWWELKKYNVDVLSVNPGSTQTEFDRIAGDTYFIGTRQPQDVVRTAMKSLGKKPNCVDGIPNKMIAFFSRLLPRKLLVNISGNITSSLYRRRK